MTQGSLGRHTQIPAMVRDMKNGESIPLVELFELEDETLEIKNGHHRCTALLLAGVEYLNYGEYILFPVLESRKRRFWRVKDSPMITSGVC